MMLIEQVEGFIGKLAKREKILLAIAIFLFSLALMDVLMLGPILKQLGEMQGEIQTKHASIKRDLRILSFRDGIIREYTRYVAYMDSGEKTQEEIVAALLQKIESIAAQKKVSISNVQPGDVDDGPIFQIYKTTLSGEGNLMDVLEFMYLLEESDYLFQVVKYELTPKSKGSEVMKFEMDIERILIEAEDIDTAAVEKEMAEEKAAQEKAAQEPQETGEKPADNEDTGDVNLDELDKSLGLDDLNQSMQDIDKPAQNKPNTKGQKSEEPEELPFG